MSGELREEQLTLPVEEVVKRGETLASIRVGRSPKHGTTVNIKLHKAFEDFFSGLCDGEVAPVTLMGRYWTKVGEQDLLLYTGTLPALSGKDALRVPETGRHYVVNKAGHPLLDENGILNISFIKLRGASEGNGVIFGVSGVHTPDALRSLNAEIGRAVKHFYITYLRPMDFSVQVSTQELTY